MPRNRPRGAPATATGERVYAIGDVHGCYDTLRNLLDRIGDHEAALQPLTPPRILLLGDLIDRGPDSARVLGFLYRLQKRSPRITVLAGNHEALLLDILGGDITPQRPWLEHGGRATLASYGVRESDSDEHPWALATRLHDAIGPDIVMWLRNLPLFWRSGDYFFCHAGVRPGIALRRQSPADLLWVRKEFLEDERWHGAMVVHGHSLTVDVQVRENRIGIDTGAYRTGRLSALYLDGTCRKILATG